MPTSRHDRFNGFLDDSFIERYAARCAEDGTVIVAYIVDGVVRGAAELHPPEERFAARGRLQRGSLGAPPERRHRPVQPADRGSALEGLQAPAHHTGAENHAMRALARKFGANLAIPSWRIDRHDRSRKTPEAELAELAASPFTAGRAFSASTRPAGRSSPACTAIAPPESHTRTGIKKRTGKTGPLSYWE